MLAIVKKNSKDSKAKKDSNSASKILEVVGLALGTFATLSSDELNKSADDLNDEIFGVTRRGYYIFHRNKSSFVVPTVYVLIGGSIGRIIGTLIGKLF